jgi:hypothetical protein
MTTEPPDVFADVISLSTNPYAACISFLLSEPTAEGEKPTARLVARVRLAPALAKQLGEALSNSDTEKPT